MPGRHLPRSVALLAALWLGLGLANVVRGVPHAGAGYRFWAFQHHCYSDVLALHGDRYLGGAHPLPYLDDRVEYPPLLGLALWLPSYAPGGALGHLLATYAFLALCLAAALWALARTEGAAAWWLGATPALAYYAGLNWDLLPIALVALALLALERGRAGGAGALAAAGVSAKLFPAVLGPIAMGALVGRRGSTLGPARPAVAFAAAGVGTLLALNAPVALAAWDGYSWFFRFNAGRGAENSLWSAVGLAPGPLLEVLSTAPFAIATSLAAAFAFRAARRGAGDALVAVKLGTGLALVVWIATSKIWSPQYALYGFLAGALAAAPRPWFLVLTAMSVADFHLAFEVRSLRWDPWFLRTFVRPAEVARSLLWLGFAGWLAVRLARGATGVGPARPDPAGPATGEHLVLFDGGCGLCSRLVRFVARRDPAGRFCFAALEGVTGRAALARLGAAAPPVDADTFVLVTGWRERPEVLVRVGAALFVTARLVAPWRWLRVFAVLPARWLDAGYRLVARHRRRLFAPPPACALPDPALRARLLDP